MRFFTARNECCMSACPYTWFKSFFNPKSDANPSEASSLRVTVEKNAVVTVDVTLPARSARWLIDLIPDDVVTKIRNEGIPLDAIQDDLAKSIELIPQRIFSFQDEERKVVVWLE